MNDQPQSATPATSIVSADVVSPQQFAAKIKEKYPQYSSVPDGQLVQKVLQKYPQYGNQIQGFAQRRSDRQPALVMPGADAEKMGFSQPRERTRADRAADFITRNAPTIAGGIGGFEGGITGGVPGAVAGAYFGGAAGGALRDFAQGKPTSPIESAKEGGKQAAWELAGGALGTGIGKVAKLLGVNESLMKFALHTGEDLDRGINPAAAINKYQLKGTLNRELYQATQKQIGNLAADSDALLTRSLPTAQTIRPYAVIKGVLDKYENAAAKTASADERNAIRNILQDVRKEFGPKSPNQIMSIQEANTLKRQWGDTVDWAKQPAQDKLQAVYKTEMEARRDIYNALNESIANSMGPEGKVWLAKNKDIQNLIEARSLINAAANRPPLAGKGVVETLTNTLRQPGVASQVAPIAQRASGIAQQFGSALPELGRSASLIPNALYGQSTIPTNR